MEQKIFQKILNKLYPGITITEYQIFPRNQLNEKNEWIPDSPAIFVWARNDSDNSNMSMEQISNELTGLTGFEVNINRY
jgi:uncharacterized protein YjaG (DUF416 family)